MSLKLKLAIISFLNLVDGRMKGIGHKKEVLKLVWIRFQRRGLCWLLKTLDFSLPPSQ